jgi:hypothetical protein
MVSLGGIARKIFGSSNDRRVKSMRPRTEAINAMENEMAALSDEQLRARTEQFRQDIANGATLDDLLIPAFATVREAAKRVLGMRPFDVQLIGGMVLHERRHRRDAHRRRQDAGRDPARSISMRCPARASMSSPSTTISPSATRRMDGPRLQVPGPDRRRHRARLSDDSVRRPMPAT